MMVTNFDIGTTRRSAERNDNLTGSSSSPSAGDF